MFLKTIPQMLIMITVMVVLSGIGYGQEVPIGSDTAAGDPYSSMTVAFLVVVGLLFCAGIVLSRVRARKNKERVQDLMEEIQTGEEQTKN